ncbi:MAG TPA: 30S ribosomal protein S6 [Oceanipulchritudo sp.]|nr:30S ribosomal protein S6 [Oceanipulchritudo sp.]
MSLQKNRKYKINIILDSRGYDAPVGTIEEKVSALLKDLGGEVATMENQGRRDFTRVTEKGHTGDTYLYVEVSGPASLPAAFQERIRLDRLIKRGLFQSA